MSELAKRNQLTTRDKFSKRASRAELDPQLRLGAILLKRRYVNSAQLRVALRLQAASQIRLGEALLQLGYISPAQLKRALRRQNWARSVAAGIALLTSPVCPLFAEELPTEDAIFNVRMINDQQQPSVIEEVLAHRYSTNFRLTIATASTKRDAGLQFNLATADSVPGRGLWRPGNRFSPELSVYTTLDKPLKGRSTFQPTRSDRYKNTIPAIIRLTLKGYCLMEVQDGDTQAWSFNRVKDRQQRKYELMLSVTKYF